MNRNLRLAILIPPSLVVTTDAVAQHRTVYVETLNRDYSAADAVQGLSKG